MKVIRVSFIESQCKKGIHTGVALIGVSVFGQIELCTECFYQISGSKVSIDILKHGAEYAKKHGLNYGIFIEVKQTPFGETKKELEKLWQS